ncbi:hypothetical protein SAICODRAFT_10301 [Saitoella complicata NRRL Y-17804]|nr:uncharacterized protein SAICODRAFT_10301 [Saitoella complicata NRRL Y-17804]ODQ50005.1 hypothetical protein SAICODRAFT_10301 [Saitoella complicata NRRL Y-17804]
MFRSVPPLCKHLRLSPRVAEALRTKAPVVALESTIVTHGMPYPENLAMARDVEAVVRRNGAEPATVAVLDGVCHVGLTDEALESLAKIGTKAHKVSRRDMAVVTSKSLTGGTTVSGTMILAHQAGIKVFVTGGIGGVHRDAQNTMDVSADLLELSRTPVAVICAGPKAILDIPRTMEVLETHGVTVATISNANNAFSTDIPAFWTQSSGVMSPTTVADAEEAARIIHAGHSMGLTSSTLICNPIPPRFALPEALINNAINTALRVAEQRGIKGKDITPFLLRAVKELTKGKSLEANIGLVMWNAEIGARIAKEVARLDGWKDETVLRVAEEPVKGRTVAKDEAPLLVVGSVAMDATSTLSASASSALQLHTSHPGRTITTPGGVGLNLATAAAFCGVKDVRLVSRVGSDESGKALLEHMDKFGLDTSGVKIVEGESTGRYTAVHDQHGELVVAIADMNAAEHIAAEDVAREIERAKPRWVCLDGNLSPDTIASTVKAGRASKANVFFEPTSAPKSGRLFSSTKTRLPLGCISVAKPNTLELEAMFEAARTNEYFADEGWWQIIDGLGTGPQFRRDVEVLFRTHPMLRTSGLFEAGLVQQAVHLLPYVPVLLITLGRLGVIAVQLLPPESGIAPTSVKDGRIVARGLSGDVCIQWYPPVAELGEGEIVSVSGAGDSFAAAVLAELVREPGFELGKLVERGQRAAVLSLKSNGAVSEELKMLK